MALETGGYVADLNAANPAGTDPKSQGDDHIRLLKTVLKNSFAGFPGAVVVTGAEAQGATANDYGVTVTPAPGAYSTSMLVVFKATHANTGAATLKINALSAKALKALDGGALEAGDIENGALCAAFYDGADFLLVSGNDRAARGGDTYGGAHDFTGATARVATQAAADNSTKAASTAYVDAADALKADLVSPTFTGAPAAPTAAPGTNTTQLATTAFATQLAFQAALPVQTGEAVNRFLSSISGEASWGFTLATQAEAEAGDASTALMTVERTAQAIAARARVAPDVIIQDQKSSGTQGQALSGSWTKLNANTLVRNVDSLASITADEITLPGGDYFVQWFSEFVTQNPGATGTANVATRLYSITGSVQLGRGNNAFMMTAEASTIDDACSSSGVAFFTLAGSSTIRLDAYVSGVTVRNGRAVGIASTPEVYNTIMIWKAG